MTPLRGTILLASLATIGAVLGGLAGATIGFIAPGYYRVIFEDGLTPAVDPIQVGAGLGAGQGAGGRCWTRTRCSAGCIAGLAIGSGRKLSVRSQRAPPWR